MVRGYGYRIEQSTPVDLIKGSVKNSLWVPEFDMKHLKDILADTLWIKMKTTVKIF